MGLLVSLRPVSLRAAVGFAVFAAAACTVSIGDVKPGDAGRADDASPPDAGGGEAGAAGVRLLQSAPFSKTSTASSVSAALQAPVTEGSLLVAAVALFTAGGDVTYHVEDTLGHVWTSTQLFRCSNGAFFAYVENARGGADTVTVTQTSALDGGTGFLDVAIAEYAGIAKTQALEGVAGRCAPSSTAAIDTGPLSTASADLLVSLLVDGHGTGLITPGADWATVVSDPSFHAALADRRGGGAGMPPGTYSGTGTNPVADAFWVGTIAAFRLAR